MKIGIIYVYYDDNPVVFRHLSLIQQYNQDCTVVPVRIKTDNVPINKKLLWRNCDLVIYDWYRNDRKVECDYWIYLEWDTHCTVPLRPIYEPAYPCTASIVKLNPSTSNWYWFKDLKRLPRQYHQFACGVVPLCGIAICDDGLAKISEAAPRGDIFCELRFGTLANYFGYTPTPLKANNNLTAHRVFPYEPGLWHKVKG
jgi:hypothetical protein